MGLFKVPKRVDESIDNIIKRTNEVEDYKPTIRLKGAGGNLIDRISMIANNVRTNLGEDSDKYLCITDGKKFIEYCTKAVASGVVAIDTETTGLEYKDQANFVGLCIYSLNQKPAYIPYGHLSVVTEKLSTGQINKDDLIKGLLILNNSKAMLVWHNAYYDLVVLYLLTGVWFRVDWDTLIGAWLLNENESHGLKELYNKYIMKGEAGVHKFAELFEGIPFCYIPYNVGYFYGAHDAEMTLLLYLFQKPYLTKGSKECEECDLVQSADIFHNMELPLIQPLCEMRVNGIDIDDSKALELRKKYASLKEKAEKTYTKALDKVRDAIQEYNDCHSISIPLLPNFNSSAQLSTLFYDILKIGIVDKKKPRSTDSATLTSIMVEKRFEKSPAKPIASAILEVRTFDKLLGSFIDKLPPIAHEYGGKIHCSFNQLGAKTGRFSSSNPNLQQIPSKYKDIRQMFVPKEGNVFINCDYSQQEMMAVAALAQDKLMLESFAKGRDIYSHIASIAFNLPYEDCLEFYEDGSTNKEGKARRKKAKSISLGIVYGKGVPAIADDLHVTVDKAQEIKDSILKSFPQLKMYLDNIVDYCKTTGYVKTFYGRKRRLPDIQLDEYSFGFPFEFEDSSKEYYEGLYRGKLKRCRSLSDKNAIIKQAESKGITIFQNGGFIAKAVRESYNAPVQGTAADITKKAMINIASNKRLKEMGAKLVLTIHDESCVSVPREYAYEAAKLIEKCSIDAGEGLGAPLRCDIAISDRWEGQSYTFDSNKNLIPIGKGD